MVVERRTIPLKNDTFNILFQAVQCAAEHKKTDDQAETVTNAINKDTTTVSSHPVNLKKRKALNELDRNRSE